MLLYFTCFYRLPQIKLRKSTRNSNFSYKLLTISQMPQNLPVSAASVSATCSMFTSSQDMSLASLPQRRPVAEHIKTRSPPITFIPSGKNETLNYSLYVPVRRENKNFACTELKYRYTNFNRIFQILLQVRPKIKVLPPSVLCSIHVQ